jgi:hypothetical protein
MVMSKTGDWMISTMNAERDAHAGRQAAAVARKAAQERDAAVLARCGCAWWAAIGEGLAAVADAAALAAGRPIFRIFDRGSTRVLGLIADPAASVRFMSDLTDPPVVWVATASPLRARWVSPWPVVVVGDRLHVGGAADPAAFVRAVVEPWLKQVCPLALARSSDVLGRAVSDAGGHSSDVS